MPRRKRQPTPPRTWYVQVLCWIVGLVIVTPLLSAALHQMNSPLGAVALIVSTAAMLLLAAQFIAILHLRRQLKLTVVALSDQHMDALVRRRAQLVGRDAYGAMQFDRWHKEIDRFIQTQVTPNLSKRQQRALRDRRAQTARLIDERVTEAAKARPAFRALPDNATPGEFEAFCAEQLQLSGWDAHVTKASRDQGVDVIATKSGVRVILQCKLYSKPVGNKAVQEAAAGRLHEGARYAAVVSNRGFTSAAEELARTNDVLLLHHAQLCELDKVLGIIEAERAS